MRRTIRKCQNQARAIELKLEEETPNKFHLILAAITIRSVCVSGLCEGSREEDLSLVEGKAYQMNFYGNFRDAAQAYDIMKEQYIN